MSHYHYVIVWLLSLTNFCIWHHESCDQKNKRGIFFISKYQSLLQKNRNHGHLVSIGCPWIIDIWKNTLDVTLSLCHTIKTVFSDFFKMKSFVGQNSSVFVRSEPYNSAEEKSELFFRIQFCTGFVSNVKCHTITSAHLANGTNPRFGP